MKKIYKSTFLGAALFVIACSFLSPQKRSKEREYKKKEQSKPMTAEAPPIGAYNAPARIDVANGWDYFITSDFIFWQALEDGLEYAASTHTALTADTIDAPPTNGRVLNVDFGWHPGVKVGMGGCTERDNWDIYLQWTHLVSHNNTSSEIPTDGFLIPATVFPSTSLAARDQAFSSWRCIYNTIDLEVGRSFYLGKQWVTRFYGGVRSGWIRQTYNTEYTDVVASTNLVEIGTVRDRNTFNTWGLGPRVGVDFNWLLGCGFSLFEKNAVSLLYTKPKAELREIFNEAELSLRNSKGNSSVRPNFDLEAGFGWGTYFADYGWHVDLALAYEFHFWLDQNFSIHPLEPLNYASIEHSRGNLALHGGTFRVRFDF